MRRVLWTVGVLGVVVVAGCLGGGEVRMSLVDWDRPSETSGGGRCSGPDDLHHPTLEVETSGESSVDLQRDRWEAVWAGQTAQHVFQTDGSRNLPPGETVRVELWFCPEDGVEGRPDRILLYDRPVHYTDNSTGAKVVGRLTV